MLSPPWIALNRSATVGPLLVHQHPAPLPRSGFVPRQQRAQGGRSADGCWCPKANSRAATWVSATLAFGGPGPHQSPIGSGSALLFAPLAERTTATARLLT